MIRPVALALAVLLAPCGAIAEPSRTPEAVLAAASLWIVGHWTFEEALDAPNYGPGRAIW